MNVWYLAVAAIILVLILRFVPELDRYLKRRKVEILDMSPQTILEMTKDWKELKLDDEKELEK